MTEYKSMVQRINKANTIEQLTKLDASLDRLWKAGIFTVYQFQQLDSHICDRRVEVSVMNIYNQEYTQEYIQSF